MQMEERVLELKAEVLKALAQPTRLKILECLREGEKCICEIVPAINGEYFATHFTSAKIPSDFHPQGRSAIDGESAGFAVI